MDILMEDLRVKLAEIKKDIEYLIKENVALKEQMREAQQENYKRSTEIKDTYYIAESAHQKAEEYHDEYKASNIEVLKKITEVEKVLETTVQLKAKTRVLYLQALLSILAAAAVVVSILYQTGVLG